MAVTKNARLFLEREGFRPTYRRPASTFIPGDSEIHSYPVSTPLPRPDGVKNGYPAPDKAVTSNDPWPHGNEESS